MPESRSSLAVPPVEISSTPMRDQLAGELDQSGFVGDAENGALNFGHEGPSEMNLTIGEEQILAVCAQTGQ